jgi:hypothetical protein
MSLRKISVVLLAVAALAPVAAEASEECAPPRVNLGNFPPEAATRPFYPVVEPDAGQASAFFWIVASGGCGANVLVDYATSGGTATQGVDYEGVSGTMFLPTPPDDTPVMDSVEVRINADTPPPDEAIVESANVVLSNPVNAGFGFPTSAPILIIDSDAPTRVGFDPDPYSQSETFVPVRIPVFLAGPAPGGTVSYSIEPSGASPATPGADFTGPTSGTLIYAAGERMKTIDFSLVNDDQGEGPEEVTITVSGLGPASSTTFTILDNEESEPPRSRLHHPRHKWKYKKSDFRIREVHVFATDTGGAGVTGAQFGLRRNMKNGNCKWLTKEGWQKKDCSNRQWLETRYDDVGQLWYYRPKQLKSSVGTKIKNYTAFSRAIDGAGNVEKEFNEKRNANTFEVKRRRKR